MSKIFKISCRGSWLSMAQANLFIQKARGVDPSLQFEIVVRESAGDKNLSTPLHLLEGKDFFTKAIQEALHEGKADFAVHSMKDVGSPDFFANSIFGVIDRDDPRDVAVFNPDVLERIADGHTIRMGTSSPRRAAMAMDFLHKALPVVADNAAKLEALSIRGNVERRLEQLSSGSYDGVVLAAAGLNRLLRHPDAKEHVSGLLFGKKKMILPLIECTPATGQGAIVAEAVAENKDAVALLRRITDKDITADIQTERKFAADHGHGCSQAFGAVKVNLADGAGFTYLSGLNSDGSHFSEWHSDFSAINEDWNIFSTTDYMKDFFGYSFSEKYPEIKEEAVFVASHKILQVDGISDMLQTKKVWAAGTKTWFALSKTGIWVEGCADGLGLQNIETNLSSPLISIQKQHLHIITNSHSALNWQKEGYLASGLYVLQPNLSTKIVDKLKVADAVFWTSYQQFLHYGLDVKSNAKHICLPGKTARLLREQGITPIVIPAIKAFNAWRVKNIP
ncbi:MAG: hydroxymethylbilane synthase [Ferruginibacter sp.]|nr:hydroxymethylbilane synthase [Ferruginibacter sp.]